jgi:hypothetical protein
MGKHRAIDPDEPFEHPHAITARAAEERDRVIRERGQRNG